MSQLSAKVPVGFRFHPTDEELVGYYLPKKVGAMKIDLDLIRDLDLYKLEPWDLQDLCKIQADANEKQTDYYFFSRKDKKYPTGNRANRATTQGFWKATGRDKPIHTKLQTPIGMRKTLVFYQGRAPHGVKTDWIMHEFRLDDGPGRPAHEDGGWVVCRVFKKNKNLKMKLPERALSYEEQMGLLPEPMGSPDILSRGSGGTSRFAFPDQSNTTTTTTPPMFESVTGSVKREIINLDDYSPSHGIHHYLNNYNCFPTRSLSMKRPEYDVHNHNNFFIGEFDQTVAGDAFHAGTSGSDGETYNNINDVDDIDSAIPGGLENVDWSALLQEPTTSSTTTTTKTVADPSVGGDVTVLLQLKRQNSDIFSSLDLWNYNPVAQLM